MEAFLDRLHARARRLPALQRLAVIARILLALALIPTGMVKLLGERFTLISPDNPIGAFFEAMYQTGAYWRFLGLSQVLTGTLLLIPRTATLGAATAFLILVNILVVTVSLHFTGTPVVTGLMTLAGLFLLCWDYDRYKAILFPSGAPVPSSAPFSRLEVAGYIMGTAAGLGVLGISRSLVPREAARPLLGVGAVAAVMVGAAWWRLTRRPRTARG